MKLNCVLPLLGLLVMMVSANANYIDKTNITGILYPSEDTNKNRIPIHVSEQVLCARIVWAKHESRISYQPHAFIKLIRNDISTGKNPVISELSSFKMFLNKISRTARQFLIHDCVTRMSFCTQGITMAIGCKFKEFNEVRSIICHTITQQLWLQAGISSLSWNWVLLRSLFNR